MFILKYRMKKTIKRLAANPIISGSFFVFSGGVVANLFNFLFNLALSRNLEVKDYGAIVSLISITLLAAIPISALIPTIVAVSGAFFAKDDMAGLKAFYLKLFNPLVFISLIFFVGTLLTLPYISEFLKINNTLLLVLAAIAIAVGYLGTINLGFLQGKLAFKVLSIGNVFSSAAKLGLGFFLVIIGFGVEGAMFAYVFSLSIPLFIGFYVLRDVFMSKIEKLPHISFRELGSYGIPSAITVFSLNSFISTDIILVKHFFPPEQAGLYAGLSLVGKVIYYITAPIATVMFPTIIQRYNKKQNYMKIFILSIALVATASAIICTFYQFFPTFVILFFLKNTQYLGVVNLVGLFAIFMAIYSLVSILAYFYLSINKTKIYYFVSSFAVLQILLIVLFHSSFFAVIINSIISSSLLLFALLLYYFIIRKNRDE